MGDSYSSDDRRGGGGSNRDHNQNRNRNRSRSNNRSNDRGGNRNRDRKPREGASAGEWKPSGNRGPRKPEPKPTFFQKILAFFGLGKKKTAPPKKGTRPAGDRKERPKREHQPIEVTNSRLFVGNIDYNVDEAALAEHFRQVGEVISAEIVMNPQTGRPKGFAFVEMGNIDEAKKAVAELNDKPLLSRSLLISGAKSKGPAGSGDREPRERRPEGRERPRREDGGRGGRERREGGDGRREGREKREHSDSKDPAMKPIEIEKVSGAGLRLENTNPEFSQDDLNDLFEGIGKIEDSHIDEGFTLIQMVSEEDAQRAVELLHAKDFMGQRLKLFSVALEKAEIEEESGETTAVESA